MGELKYTQLGIDDDEAHSKVLALVPPASRVLEVGAATGYMTEALRAKGCEVTALEPNPDAVAAARSRGIDVRCAFLRDVRDEIGTFDCVLLVDVLEHVYDAQEILRDCRSVLRPHGNIVVSVPNVAHWSIRWNLLRGRFEYTKTGLMDDTHVKFYTSRTLEALVNSVGLRVRHRDHTLGLYSYPQVPRSIDQVVNVSWHRRKLVRWLVRQRPALFGFQHVLVLEPGDAQARAARH